LSEYFQTIFDKFELQVRKEYRYTEDDLWVHVEDGKARIGVTDYLQRTSGDVAFIETARQGSRIQKKGELGTMETAKTTVTLYSPLSGQVTEVNRVLAQKPELLNSAPYKEGWLVIITPYDLEGDAKSLLSAEDYYQLMLGKLRSGEGRLESR